jgi:multidrug efflux pump subunit AcrA (membrane-fusion protein)
MKEHIKSLPHHPKRVIVISLIIAIAIGTFGYLQINQKPVNLYSQSKTEIITNKNNSVSANQNLTLGFLSSGRIKTIAVKAGDVVKKGEVLATLDAGNVLGALIQAKAAYSTAEANYKKIINGATGAAIDVAKAAVNTAKVNLEGITNQQNLLVKNAKTNLLNSTLVAKPKDDLSITPPVISGTYNKDTEGKILISVYQTGNGAYFTISGLVTGEGIANTTNAEPIVDTGLYIQFPKGISYISTAWEISIPNNTAPNYLVNYNAYQTALETKNQAISNAQASLDQANASLAALVTAARPEDVSVAQAQVDNALGAVKIAEAAYNNTIITAPQDGKIVAVSIIPDQIAIANAPAIEFLSANSNY